MTTDTDNLSSEQQLRTMPEEQLAFAVIEYQPPPKPVELLYTIQGLTAREFTLICVALEGESKFRGRPWRDCQDLLEKLQAHVKRN